MSRRTFFTALISALCGTCFLVHLSAQPPAKVVLAPAQARLDQTISGLAGPGFAIGYSEDLGMAAAACEQGAILCWNKDVLLGIRAGAGTANVLRGHDGPVTNLAWNGGPVIASAGAGKLLLWSVADGRILHALATDKQVRSLAMSPDGKHLASAGDDSVIRLWDVDTGKPRAELAGHTDWVLCLTFSPDGKWLTSGGYDGVARLWDVAEEVKIRELPIKPMPPPKEPPDRSPLLALAFSPDAKQLALAGADGVIHILNPQDGKLLRSQRGHTSAVTGLLFHPSGNLLVSTSKDRTIRLWNLANGQIFKVLEGHTSWVQGAVFIAHGTRIASVGADQTVRVWDLTETPKK